MNISKKSVVPIQHIRTVVITNVTARLVSTNYPLRSDYSLPLLLYNVAHQLCDDVIMMTNMTRNFWQII